MLKVTDSARQLLKETLKAQSDDPEVSLRLSLKQSGQFEIVPDREVQGDQVVKHEGVKVLLVAPELAPIIEGVTLDVQDTPDGPRLTVLKG
jgi:Fe-S cluster assembly iron-binding protein IscA